MKFRVFGATFAAALMVSGIASAKVYECKIKEGPYIPGLMIISEEDDGVVVYDGLIKTVYDKPINGKVAVDNAKRTTYAWKVKGFKTTESNSGRAIIPTLSFRLTRQKSDNTATVQAKAVGYTNTFRSSGKCKATK